jgi:hypothetical protein
MTNTSVVIRAIDRVISLHRNLLSSASIFAASTFIVSTSWCCGSNHQSPIIPYFQYFIATLKIIDTKTFDA